MKIKIVLLRINSVQYSTVQYSRDIKINVGNSFIAMELLLSDIKEYIVVKKQFIKIIHLI